MEYCVAYKQKERYIYGNSRIGVNNKETDMYATNSGNSNVLSHEMGLRSYELSNHLGNVLSVISDKVIPHPSGSTVAYYKADILQSQDYSPFGVTLKGRNLKKTGLASKFRFGFNGKEATDELSGEGNSYDFGARMMDPRLGRWLKTDLMEAEAPSWTPYRYGFNNPIRLKDIDGNFEIDEATAASYPMLDAYLKNLSVTYANKPADFKKAFKQYSELSDAQVTKMLEYKKVKNGTPVKANQQIPRIVVKDLSGQSANGVTEVSYTSKDANGNLIGAKATGTIQIDKGIVSDYEKHGLSTNEIDRNAALIVLESTVFHEATHYGDALSDGKQDQTNNSQEGGKMFEIKAYGEDIGNSTTTMNRFNLAREFVKKSNFNLAYTAEYMKELNKVAQSYGFKNAATIDNAQMGQKISSEVKVK